MKLSIPTLSTARSPVRSVLRALRPGESTVIFSPRATDVGSAIAAVDGDFRQRKIVVVDPDPATSVSAYFVSRIR